MPHRAVSRQSHVGSVPAQVHKVEAEKSDELWTGSPGTAADMNESLGRFESIQSSTIMMVDDEPTTLDVLEILLRGEGYANFVSTTEPGRALDLIAERRPDVLLLNLMMPEVGGLEILSGMRADEALKDIPVIILTASTDSETKLRALELGANDFLAKPVDPSELALRLRNILVIEAYRKLAVSPRRGEEPVPTGARALGPRSSTATPTAPEQAVHEQSRPGLPVVSRLAGENPRLRAISERFVGRLEEKLEAIERSWQDGDFEELVSLAHWLKGASGTVGFDALTGPAEVLRLLAMERKRDDIEGAIRELRWLAERIVIPSRDTVA